MLLSIDYRERSFVAKLQEFVQEKIENDKVYSTKINNCDVTFKVLNLEVGDFIIKNLDELTAFIIERKSIRDLSSSITDGRFRQQKERLLESIQDPSKVMFILEGSKKNLKGNVVTQNIINAATQNLVCKHNFKVLFTENEFDTFENVILLYKKVSTNEFQTPVEVVAPVKLVAKGVKIRENMFAVQLSAIPGVSFNTALEIAKLFGSMKGLIDKYNEVSIKGCEQEAGKLLSGIQLGQKRKLGNALSHKIHEALCT
jgi:ERCC4-type nuclease